MRTANEQVLEQLNFIERMIRDGQQSMEKWGWAFVLWGCGHLGALLWSHLWPASPGTPWAVLMSACGLAMAVASIRTGRSRRTSTSIGRAIAAAWWGFGVSLILLWVVGGAKHIFTSRPAFVATFFILIGAANFVSGMTIRLPIQVAVGVVGWLGGVVVLVFPEATIWVFVFWALLCEVAFGFYLMPLEKKAEQSDARIQ